MMFAYNGHSCLLSFSSAYNLYAFKCNTQKNKCKSALVNNCNILNKYAIDAHYVYRHRYFVVVLQMKNRCS